MAPTPQYLMILAAPLEDIFLENSTKNKAKLVQRNNIPVIAQSRDAFSSHSPLLHRTNSSASCFSSRTRRSFCHIATRPDNTA
jgi:hypothetical protein